MAKKTHKKDDSPSVSEMNSTNTQELLIYRSDPFADIDRLTNPKPKDRKLSAMDDLISVIDTFLLERGLYSAERRKFFSEAIAHEITDALAAPKTKSDSKLKLRYENRKYKAESAVDFLKRVYQIELKEGSISLSSLRKLDNSLWAALRNWANNGGHDLDLFLPRGRDRPGRPLKEDSLELNGTADTPNPEIERKRKLNRERGRRFRARHQAPAL